jgi:flagellar biosynthesis chaperone FliJ
MLNLDHQAQTFDIEEKQTQITNLQEQLTQQSQEISAKQEKIRELEQNLTNSQETGKMLNKLKLN